MENNTLQLSVGDFIALTNQTLEYAYSNIAVEGEVSGFKINQNKYVFFDLKDELGSVSCFMMVWQLRQPIEDGMKVVVVAAPKLTNWGKFSLTVQAVRPSGEGSIKRGFELLREKLEKEGIFSPERKRLLPQMPHHIAIISSTGAAGYADFIKILNERWGGLRVEVAHVQVQGKEAPDQMMRALRYFNAREVLPEVVVMIRGGGSADDLSAFNDELLVREIAGSRVPILTGIGHETDTSLADLAADVRASTPSHAAQVIVPDKKEVIRLLDYRIETVTAQLFAEIETQHEVLRGRLERAVDGTRQRQEQLVERLNHQRRILGELDPNKVLARGYAIIRGAVMTGQVVEIETHNVTATTEVLHVKAK